MVGTGGAGGGGAGRTGRWYPTVNVAAGEAELRVTRREGHKNCDAQSDTSSVGVFYQPSTHVGPMEDGHRSPWMVRTIPTVTFVAQRDDEKPV